MNYEVMVHNQVEGWTRAAFLPGTLGFSLVCMIAEECQQAWFSPVRLVRGAECICEFGTPLPTPQKVA